MVKRRRASSVRSPDAEHDQSLSTSSAERSSTRKSFQLCYQSSTNDDRDDKGLKYIQRETKRAESAKKLVEGQEDDNTTLWHNANKSPVKGIKNESFMLEGHDMPNEAQKSKSHDAKQADGVYHWDNTRETIKPSSPVLEVKQDQEIQVEAKDVTDEKDIEDVVDSSNPVAVCVDYRVPALTGYFRDQVRRVDMVLVMDDSGDENAECFRRTFLRNLALSGIDLEMEPGLMCEHRCLIFVKLHAREDTIYRLAHHFDTFKYFKANHLFFMNEAYEFEKVTISAIRGNYPGPLPFSTSERSHLVYRLLLTTRFGPDQQHFGLNRMLDNKYLKDAYALHDGPYFFLGENYQAMMNINGRQVLFERWKGFLLFSLIQPQPLNTIREYFGERIAFLFAFYEYFTKALVIPSIYGIVSTFLGLYLSHTDSQTKAIRNEICSPSRTSAATKKLLRDKVKEWIWRETYFYWLWEVRENAARYIRRPDFDYSLNFPGQTYIKFFGALLIFCFYMFVLIRLFIMLEWQIYKRVALRINKVEDIFYAGPLTALVLAVMNAILILMMEQLSTKVCVCVVHWAGHYRTERHYEGAFAKQLFSLNLFFNLGLIFYYDFLKGSHSQLSIYPTGWEEQRGFKANWQWYATYLTPNCGPLPCIDEVLIAFLATCFFYWLFKLTILPITMIREPPSEYKRNKWTNERIPCWEKEYLLMPFTEKKIMCMYNKLMIQFVFVTFFAGLFPAGAFFAMVVNMFTIRYWARRLLLRSRRPVLVKSSGMGSWNLILQAIPYLAVFWNSVTLVRQSIFLPKMHHRQWFKDLDFFRDYYLSVFSATSSFQRNDAGLQYNAYLSDFKTKKNSTRFRFLITHIQQCFYPGLYTILDPDDILTNKEWGPGDLERYYTHTKGVYLQQQSYMLITVATISTMILGFIINGWLRPRKEIVHNSITVEEMIKYSRVRRREKAYIFEDKTELAEAEGPDAGSAKGPTADPVPAKDAGGLPATAQP